MEVSECHRYCKCFVTTSGASRARVFPDKVLCCIVSTLQSLLAIGQALNLLCFFYSGINVASSWCMSLSFTDITAMSGRYRYRHRRRFTTSGETVVLAEGVLASWLDFRSLWDDVCKSALLTRHLRRQYCTVLREIKMSAYSICHISSIVYCLGSLCRLT